MARQQIRAWLSRELRRAAYPTEAAARPPCRPPVVAPAARGPAQRDLIARCRVAVWSSGLPARTPIWLASNPKIDAAVIGAVFAARCGKMLITVLHRPCE